MRRWFGLLCLAGAVAGCVCPPVPPPCCVPAAPPPPPPPAPPTTLAQPWMFGIEPMAGDAEPMLPFTNRLLFNLAAQPNTQVVYLGAGPNGDLFAAYAGRKLRVASSLHGEGQCMTMIYTSSIDGRIEGSFSLIVPALLAGTEPDTACIDRAATALYQALARQGF